MQVRFFVTHPSAQSVQQQSGASAAPPLGETLSWGSEDEDRTAEEFLSLVIVSPRCHPKQCRAGILIIASYR